MLMQLKNKQRKIASVALSAFIGSWLFLLCQTCFADNDDNNSRSELTSAAPISCHTPENNDLEKTSTADDDHCLGVCDCDAITMVLSTDKNSELKVKSNYSPDISAYVTPEIIISTRAPPSYRISTSPERAILLPLQSYNVLLI